MPHTLTVDSVQASAWCNCAARGHFLASSDPHSSRFGQQQLVVCCQDVLSIYIVKDTDRRALQLLQTLALPEVFQALVTCPPMHTPPDTQASTHSTTDRMLAVTADGRCLVLSLVEQLPSRQQPAISILDLPVHIGLQEHACVKLPSPPSLYPRPLREDGIRSSPSLHLLHSHTAYIALSVFHDTVHVVHIKDSDNSRQQHPMPSTAAPQTTVHVLTFDMKAGALQALKPGLDPYSHIRHSLRVEALELMPLPIRMSGQSEEAWMIAVLYSLEGPGSQSLNLECLECDPATFDLEKDPDAGQEALIPGPWACRNMHPTTTLVTSFPAMHSHSNNHSSSHSSSGAQSAYLPYGMLAISSTSLVLLTLPTRPQIDSGVSFCGNSGAFKGGGAAQKLELLRYSMVGVPSCMEVLWRDVRGRVSVADKASLVSGEASRAGAEARVPPEAGCKEEMVLIVADSMAGIYLMHLGSKYAPWMQRVTVAGGPLSPASVLHFLILPTPTAPQSSAHKVSGEAKEGSNSPDGLLFLGSTHANSQLLQVPALPCSPSNQPPGQQMPGSGAQQSNPQQEPPAGPPPVWPLLDAAFIKSLAPVQDCVLVPGAEGAADPTLLVGCGVAPFGRLARAKLGCALTPYFGDGPVVPEGARLFALNSKTVNTHLAFSFDALGSTAVMQLQDGTLTHTSLPGLQSDLPSLLLHTTPASQIVQVTRQGVALLAPLPHAEAIAHWPPHMGACREDDMSCSNNGARALGDDLSSSYNGGPVSLAAAWGSVVVVATATHVLCLVVQEGADCAEGSSLQEATASGVGEQQGGSGLRLVSSMELPHQVSALHVCAMGHHGGKQDSQGGGLRDVVVVIGFWLQNQAVVVSGADLSCQLACLELGEETARSAALLSVTVQPSNTASGNHGVQEQQQQQQQEQEQQHWVLGVGTNSGLLMLWEVKARTGSQAEPILDYGKHDWELSSAAAVRISNVAVELSIMPDSRPSLYKGVSKGGNGAGTAGKSSSAVSSALSAERGGGSLMMYAHSASDVVVRARTPTHTSRSLGLGSSKGPEQAVNLSAGKTATHTGSNVHGVSGLVEVVRVHGSSHLRSLCVLETPRVVTEGVLSAPGRAASNAGSVCEGASVSGALAWVTAGSRLLMGELDPEAKLRWTTAFIGETPHHIAHHVTSGCFVILSEDAHGQQWLRLVHGATLQPVTAMRLAPGHAYTSLLVTALPCSSSSSTTTGGPNILGAPAASAAGPKEFIVLGSHLVLEGGVPVGSRPQAKQAGSAAAGEASRHASEGALSLAGRGAAVEPGSAPRRASGDAASDAGTPAPGVGWAAAGNLRVQGEGGPEFKGVGALQQVQGLLSVFEVAVSHAPPHVASGSAAEQGAAAGGAGMRPGVGVQQGAASASGSAGKGMELLFSLMLHGTSVIDSMALCLAATSPTAATSAPEAAHAAGGSQGGAMDAIGSAAQPPQGGLPALTVSAAAMHAAAAADLHLIVGCHDGVRAYAVHVDDGRGSQVGGAAVASALGATSNVPPAFPAYVPPPEGLFVGQPSQKQQQEGAMESEEDDGEEAMQVALDEYQRQRQALLSEGGGEEDPEISLARATTALQQALRKDWSQHVTLKLVANASSFANCAVTSIKCEGPLVVASDFMASVSLYTLERQVVKDKAAKAATTEGAPSSSTASTVTVLQVTAVDRHALCTSAAAPCAQSKGVLVATHPQGLVMLKRDEAQEQEVWNRALAEAEKDAHTGQDFVRRQQQQHQEGQGQPRPRVVISRDQAPSLALACACRPRHPITHILQGGLGLRLDSDHNKQGQLGSEGLAHAAPAIASHNRSISSSEGAEFLALCGDGSVLQIGVSEQDWARELLACQASLEQQEQQRLDQQSQQHAQGGALRCVGCPSLRHATSWRLRVPKAFSVARRVGVGEEEEEEEEAEYQEELHGGGGSNCVDLAYLAEQ